MPKALRTNASAVTYTIYVPEKEKCQQNQLLSNCFLEKCDGTSVVLKQAICELNRCKWEISP